MMKTMKQRTCLAAAAFTLLFGSFTNLYAQAISNVDELQRIGNDPAYPLNGFYWLTQDIDASGTALWNDEGTGIGELEGFKPIGDIGVYDDENQSWTNGRPFTGVFDGNGFAIRGLTINRPDQIGVGLFSRLADSATVRNVRLTETAVQGYYPVGGLAGLSFGTMIGCSSTGTVTGVAYVGGLAGRVEAGTLRRCHAAGSVSADLFSAGGLAGDLEAGTVSACYATAAVDGDTAVGGLVGSNFGLIDTCYAAGNVTGNGAAGGLAGEGFGSANSSYWDADESGQALSAGGEARTTAQMRQQTTFVGWDFVALWGIVENAGYPYLAPFVTDSVTLDAQGGAVAPGLLTLIVAEAYGALPLPTRTGYSFGGWWTAPAGAGAQVTAATLVTNPADHALYALWTADGHLCPPGGGAALTSPGTYTGFFYADRAIGSASGPALQGTLSLTVSRLSGRLTAGVATQKARLSFRAASWTLQQPDGTYRATLQARGGTTLDLFVRQDRVWGSLTGGALGTEVWQLDGARNRFADRNDLPAQSALNGYRGYYTVSLPVTNALSLGAAQAAPEGSGYLTLTVGSRGSVKIAGVLADGTRFTQSSRLLLFDDCGPEACVPFFVPVNSRRGWASGLFWITPDSLTVVTDRNLGWFVRWEKPGTGADGFSMMLNAVGGFYGTTPSLAANYLFSAETNGVRYHYANGATNSQPAALPDSLNVTANGSRLTLTRGRRPPASNGGYDYSAENSAQASLSFTPRTGLFKGTFNLYYDYVLEGRQVHKSVRVPYAGVLTPVRDAAFAAEPAGQGYYLVPDNDPRFRTSRLKRSYLIELESGL